MEDVPPQVAEFLKSVGLLPEDGERVVGISIFLHAQAEGADIRTAYSQVMAPGESESVMEQLENIESLTQTNLASMRGFLGLDDEEQRDEAIGEMLQVKADLDEGKKSRLRGLFSRK